MDFELTEQQKMLKSAVQDFAAKEIAPIAVDMTNPESFHGTA